MNDDLRSEVRGRQLYARHADMHRAGQPDALVLRDKMDATAGPTVNDDRLKLYSVGSRWIDVTNDKEYVCLDNSVGAAIWAERAASGLAGHAAVTLSGTPDYITLAGQDIVRGLVDLTTDVTGDLPLANVAPASAASQLLGRGSAAGAGDFQEIALGTNLSMAGTTLNATGGSGGHTIRENGVDLTARTGLNFTDGLVATDDAVGNESEVTVDYGTTTELADVTKAAESAGTSAKVARADHKHDITTAAPSGGTEGTATTLARSDHTHAGGGVSMAQVWALI